MENVNRIYSFRGKTPEISPEALILPDVTIIGDVKIGAFSSVWFQSVIRGDVNAVVIGQEVNIQDLSLLHVTSEKFALTIGNYVTVAHRVVLHGCTLHDHAFVGMGAIVMDGAEIGEYSIVGAGALVTPGKKFPPGSLILGSPAKMVRYVTTAEKEMIRQSCANYLKYSAEYRKEGFGN